jgi:hypothetical protein
MREEGAFAEFIVWWKEPDGCVEFLELLVAGCCYCCPPFLVSVVL